MNGECPEFNELVLKAKQARDYFLLIGPPGTGKTSFGLVNILKEALCESDTSVLLVSYTNRAVDEICSKLVKEKIDFIRMGMSLSCDDAYKPYLLERQMETCQNIQEIRKKIQSTRVFVGTTTNLSSNVSIFTLKKFALAIVDEASQILEPHLLALLSAKHGDENAIDRFVLIGDHKQLPAVVLQSETDSAVTDPLLQEIGLTNCRLSLFERLLKYQQEENGLSFCLENRDECIRPFPRFPMRPFTRCGFVRYLFCISSNRCPGMNTSRPVWKTDGHATDRLCSLSATAFDPVCENKSSGSLYDCQDGRNCLAFISEERSPVFVGKEYRCHCSLPESDRHDPS